MKTMDTNILSIMKVCYNARNKFAKTGKYILLKAYTTWMHYVEYGSCLIQVGRCTVSNTAVTL